jgi:hypothetical protein
MNAAVQELYFFTMRVVHQQNSTAADPDPARNCPSAVDLRAVCQAVSRHLCKAVLQLQFSVA